MWKLRLKKAEMNNVYIGIGTNVGDRIENIQKVVSKFKKNYLISKVYISSIYETVPYGNVKQENFYNAVIFLQTSMELLELFDFTKSVEKIIGRIKRVNWGPREIDLDILLFNEMVFESENITIPHKDLLNRDFVLIPLLEIEDKLVHPKTKKELSYYLRKLKESYIVSKFALNGDVIAEKKI